MTSGLPATYQPGHSLLHRLHPLAKVAWLLGASVGVFAFPSVVLTLAWVVASGGGLYYAGMGSWRGVGGLRLLTRLALLLFAIQVLFVRTGTVMGYLLPIDGGRVPVTDDGLRAGVYVAGRLLAIVLLSYLFVTTTEPNELAHALMRAGLPYRYGYALIVALRLLPMMGIEANTVYNAQLARGVRYDQRSPIRLFLIARQLLLPLLVSTLGRVNTLAVSMEGRCFGRYPRRTFLRESQFRRADAGALALLVGLTVLVVATS